MSSSAFSDAIPGRARVVSAPHTRAPVRSRRERLDAAGLREFDDVLDLWRRALAGVAPIELG